MQDSVRRRMLWGYDLNLLAVVSISTVVLILGRYYPLHLNFPEATALTYYLLIPMAASWLLFRDKPWDYGLRTGHWKLSVVLAAVCLAAMAPVLYEGSRIADFRHYYRMDVTDWPDLLRDTALFMFAWEFLFRGYMLFGLERSIGKSAIFVQAVPFVLLHLGKPFVETLLCIPGGFFLGYVAYRTRSILPCVAIHIGMYMMMIYFVNNLGA